MFNKIFTVLKILVTGKNFVDSLASKRPPVVTPVVDPIPNLQHPAASVETTKKVRAKSSPDRTKLSDAQLQLVKDRYIAMQTSNIGLPWSEHKTTLELTQELNAELGLHKSRAFYSSVWNSVNKEPSEND